MLKYGQCCALQVADDTQGRYVYVISYKNKLIIVGK